jgi:RNA polymerase sigma-70 factor (sigma-E family)
MSRKVSARQRDFADFFAARFDSARRIAYAMCGDWVEAEEIAQTGFVRMYAHWGRVRSETADAYLRTVLTRVFLDTKRRGRARERTVAEVPDRPIPAGTEPTEERELLLAALRQVPPRQRAVLVLRFVQDLSVDQAAATLGCSTGPVKSQTARGLETLRQAYHALSGQPHIAVRMG